jgi:hypothetical protein
VPEPIAYYPDNTVIPEEKLQEAAASGDVRYRETDQDKQVHMENPMGDPVLMPTTDVHAALRAGFRLKGASEAEAQQRARAQDTVGGAVKAGIEGGLRGVFIESAGFGGEEHRKNVLARKENWGGLSTVAELGTGLASVLLTGGAAGAARGAGLLTRGLGVLGTAPRLAARAGMAGEALAARGLAAAGLTGQTALARAAQAGLRLGTGAAVEGGLYGAGKGVSEALLHGDDITAEKIWASTEDGALLGALGGMVLGPAGSLVASGVKGALRGSQRVARETLDQATVRAIGGKEAAKLTDEKTLGVARTLREYRYQAGPRAGKEILEGARTADDVATNIRAARNEAGEAVGRTLQEIDASYVARRADPALSGAERAGLDLPAFFERVRREVTDPLRSGPAPQHATAVDNALANLRPAPTPTLGVTGLPVPQAAPSLLQTELYRRKMADLVNPRSLDGKPLRFAPLPEGTRAIEQAERILDEEIKKTASKELERMGLDPELFKKAKDSYHYLSTADKMAQAVLHKSKKAAPTTQLEQAFASAGALTALLSGNFGALALGAAGVAASKLAREYGPMAALQLQKRVANLDLQLGEAAQRLVGRVERTAKSAIPRIATISPDLLNPEKRNESFQQKAAAIQDMVTRPHTTVDMVAQSFGELGGSHPDLIGALAANMQRQAAWLADKLPPMPKKNLLTLTPRAELLQQQDPTEAARWLRYYRGVRAPMDVVEDVAAGELDIDGMEAVKAAHPRMYEQLRGHVIELASELDEPLPFERRIQLSLVFDFVGDPSLEPEAIAALQAGFAAAAPPEPPGPRPRNFKTPPSTGWVLPTNEARP